MAQVNTDQKGGVFIPYPDIPDKDFYEKIYRKKEFYDTKPRPHPDPGDQTKETLEQLFSKDGDFRLTAPQRFLRNFISEATPYNGIFIWHGTGTGKCLSKDTKLLLSNGNVVKVQDIEIGDMLMSDQSKGNMVTSLARGRDDMYKIIPTKGESYTVNSEHILCLKRTQIGVEFRKRQKYKKWCAVYLDTKTVKKKSKYFETKDAAEEYLEQIHKETDDIVEIEVKDYLKLPKSIKHLLKGYRVGVDFPARKIGFDPYIIGLWLGDGSKRDPVISTQDSTVLHYLQLKGLEYDLCLNYQNGYDYRLSSFNKNNRMIDELCMTKLLNNKHIPNSYKLNSREVRLQVLAGLLDSDGSYSEKDSCYEITQKKETLSNDILFLCRSLGFAAYSKQCEKSCTYKGEKKTGTYYRIHISGEGLDQIPVKIPRKKARVRKQKKNALVTGINVKHLGIDDYYGFTLTGNKRFLLHDFTVTHNTCAAIGIAERFHNRVEESGKKILMIVGPNIRGEFLKTIFNFEREAAKKSTRQVVQCTGRTYQLGPEAKYLPEKTRERRITKMIKEVYEIIGTDKLRNRIMRETGWNGKTSTLNERIVDKLKEMYSDRVIVIDEVHNRVSTEGTDKSIPTILNAVIGSAENIRLVLMSATPMVNTPDDIIFPINLMRLNDRRELVKKREIFTVEGRFTPDGEELLREAAKGYFSYVRGGDPPRFPYEIIPPESKTPDPIYMIEGPKIPTNKKM
ncbi:MAG: Hint domain-containing homing endonuclease, partial [Candidatus Kariarchaeaceae archaeon]